MEFMSKHINYFITVAQEGSITKAAERLCITPSPLSQRIKELEDGLNIMLFERTHQGLSLTKDGRYLYNDIIAHYEGLNRVKDNHKERRHIQAGIFGAVPPHINTVVDYLLMKNPSLVINLVRLTPTEGRNRSELNQLNLLFSTESLSTPPFSQHFCAEEQLLLVHPSGQTQEQYRLLPWVQSTYFSETSIFKHCHTQLQQQGYSREVMNIDNLELRLNLIRQGKAISLALESLKPILKNEQQKCSSLSLSDTYLTHHIYSNTTLLNDSQQVIDHLTYQGMPQWSNMTTPIQNY
ncbi:TPA: LysR family transcriptional regulator [Serratia liquefaciens]|nr:LysR family transcriptional regulator [Serratia liquefaciens]